jgi:hypothetical protein
MSIRIKTMTGTLIAVPIARREDLARTLAHGA